MLDRRLDRGAAARHQHQADQVDTAPAEGAALAADDGAAAPHRASWTMAAQATLHCLTGCAIGEVLGLVLATVFALHSVPSIALAVTLAFIFGYALTMRGVVRAGLDWRTALRVALAADTVSILVMEIVDNAFVVAVPGAMDAGLASGLFWGSLAASLAVAFAVTTPVNRLLIARGKGHAAVHAVHQHDAGHARTGHRQHRSRSPHRPNGHPAEQHGAHDQISGDRAS